MLGADKLESIVCRAFDALARAEDKVVTFPLRSRLAVRHPKISAALLGTATGSLMAIDTIILYLNGGRFAENPYSRVALSSLALGAVTGFYFYQILKNHREISDAGYDTEKYYEQTRKSVQKQSPHFRSLADIARSGWNAIARPRKAAGSANNIFTAILKFPLEHPRFSALPLAALGATYINGVMRGMGTPESVIWQRNVLLVPAFYLMSRKLMFLIEPLVMKANFLLGMWDIAASMAAGITGKRSLLTGPKEFYAKTSPSIQSRFELAETYAAAGRLDEALLQAREGIEEAEQAAPNLEKVKAYHILSTMASSLRRTRKKAASAADYVIIAKGAQIGGYYGRAEETMEQLGHEFPGVDSHILSAVFLESTGEKEKAKPHWNAALQAIVAERKYTVLPVSEPGVHNVRRYGPTPLISNTLIFREGNIDDLTFEAGLISRVSQANTITHYMLPRVVAIFEHANGRKSHDLVLRFEEGQSPSEMKQNGTLTKDVLMDVQGCLGWIRANVQPELSRKGKTTIEKKAMQVLSNPYLGLNAGAREKIAYGLQPVIDELKEAPYVFAKDPHPAQWRANKKYIIPLDWEDKGAVPLFADDAKFLTHPDMALDSETIDALLEEGQKMYKRSGIIGNDAFRVPMLSGMLFQPLSFASAWSVPEMSHMRGKRANAIAMTKQAFDMLKQNHPQHYAANRQSYESLQSEFAELERRLATAA